MAARRVSLSRVTAPVLQRNRRILAFRSRLLAGTALALALTTQPAAANPQGGTVVGGDVTITQTSPTRVDITQTSAKGIINWQSFSIGANEHTNFNQSSASAITLNRVTGGNPSEILGRMTANGQVWLVNPNGVFFGPNARIDVGGLVATPHDIKNEDFMAGRYLFQSDRQPAGIVENQGTITAADAGLVAFVAPGVVNHGTINARLGEVTLASGNAFTIDFYGDQKINLALDQKVAGQVVDREGKPLDARVKTDGKIFADGGTVALSAAAAKGVVDQAINVGGIVQARTVEQKNGRIILSGDGGAVTVAGSLDASGKAAGQTGGTVSVSGTAVTVKSTARIDVSGRAGGGEALIGGEFRGGNATATDYALYRVRPAHKPVPPADTVVVEAGAGIDASALDQGFGGTVVVWGTDEAIVHGSLFARGAGAGDGGLIETSGHVLDFSGAQVDAGSRGGAAGTWLLDPSNLTVTSSGAAALGAALGSTNLTLTSTSCNVVYGDCASGGGEINIASAIQQGNAGETPTTLTLQADTNIYIGANITASASNKLNLVLNARHSGGPAGSVAVFKDSTITTRGGSVTIGGGADPTNGAAIGSNSTAIYTVTGGTVDNRRGVSVTGTIDAAGGNIVINGQGCNIGACTFSRGVSIGGTVMTSGSGTIAITGTATGSSDGVAVGDTQYYQLGSNTNLTGQTLNGSVIAAAGNITITGTRGTGTNGVNIVSGSTVKSSAGGSINLTSNGGDLNLSSVVLQSGGTLSLTATNANHATLAVSATGSGGGTLALTGALTTSGDGSTTLTATSGNLVLNSAQLTGNGTFTSAGDITVNGTLSKAAGGDATLKLSAHGDIIFPAVASGTAPNITATAGKLNTILQAGSTGTGGGIAMNVNSAITTNGGFIVLGGGTTCTTVADCGYATAAGTNAFTVGATGIALKTATLNSGGGDIALRGKSGTGTQSSIITASGGWGIATSDNTAINSGNGSITIDGVSRSTGTTYGDGIEFGSNSTATTITASGAGTITIIGDAGAASASSHNIGLVIGGSGTSVTTAGGAISLTGTGGTGASGNNKAGISIGAHGTVSSSGGGNISLTTDSLSYSGTLASATGTLTVQPKSSSVTIGVGDDTATLQLPVSLLATNFAATTVGKANAGTITFTGATTLWNSTTFVSGQDILFNADSSLSDRSQAQKADLTLQAGGAIQFLDNTDASSLVDAVNIHGNLSGGGLNCAAGVSCSATGNSTWASGVYIGKYVSLKTNSGDVTLSGTGWSGGTSGSGDLGSYPSFSYGLIEATFASVTGNNISLYGQATKGDGIQIDFGDRDFATYLTATGTLTISGDAHGGTNRDGVYFNPLTASAATIIVTGQRSGTGTGIVFDATSGGVPTLTSTAATTLTADTVTVQSGTSISGSGTLTIQPYTTGTTIGLAGGSGTLSLASSLFSGASRVFQDGFSSITVGNATAGDLTIGTTALTYSDPLTLKTAGSILVNSNASVTGVTGQNTDLVLWADADGNGSGSISLATTGITLDTKGGNLWLGGSASSGGSTSWNGLTVGNGYATGTSVNSNGIFIQGASISTGGGKIAFYGKSRAGASVGGDGGSNAEGIRFGIQHSVTVNAGTGTILMDGIAQGTSGWIAGIEFDSESGASHVITSTATSGTAITLIGDASAAATSGNSTTGIWLHSGTTLSTGGGGISLTGTGGGHATYNDAIWGNDGSGSVTINTASGALTLLGRGQMRLAATKILAGATTLTAESVDQATRYDITASNVLNDFAGTLTVAAGKNITLVDANALTLGSVTASGTVSVATLTGDLTLSGSITTTDTTSAAVVLNAGKSSAAGTSTGGDLVISGSPTVSVGSGGRATLYSGSITGSTALAALVTAGSGRFRYHSDEAATNFSTALSSGLYGIYREQPTITVTADDQTVTYGTAPSLTTSVTGLKNGDSAIQTTTTTVSVAVAGGQSTAGYYTGGSHTLTPSGGSTTPNALGYAIGYAAGTLTVNAKALTVTADAAGKTYDGVAFSGGDGVTYVGLVSGETSSVLGGTLSYAGSSQGAVNTGSYTITPQGLTSTNYAITFATGTLTVSPKPLTVTADSDTKTYDGQSYSGGAGTSLTGLVVGETAAVLGGTVSYTGSSQGAVNAGSYTITPQGLTSSNYMITFASGTLTVSPKPLTITAVDAAKTYDGHAYSGGAGTTLTGLVAGETAAVLSGTVSYTGSSQGAVNAGSYTITPQGLTSSNYAITFAAGALTVSPRPLTITAVDVTKTYDGQAYSGGAGTTLAGLIAGEIASVLEGAVSYAGSSQGAVNAGGYTITPHGLTNSNYAITYASGTLTVSPKPLTITAADAAKTADGQGYSGGAGVSYAGLVAGESAAVLAGTLSYAGTSQGAITAGSYPIIPQGFSSGNYAISYRPGALTITDAAPNLPRSIIIPYVPPPPTPNFNTAGANASLANLFSALPETNAPDPVPNLSEPQRPTPPAPAESPAETRAPEPAPSPRDSAPQPEAPPTQTPAPEPRPSSPARGEAPPSAPPPAREDSTSARTPEPGTPSPTQGEPEQPAPGANAETRTAGESPSAGRADPASGAAALANGGADGDSPGGSIGKSMESAEHSAAGLLALQGTPAGEIPALVGAAMKNLAEGLAAGVPLEAALANLSQSVSAAAAQTAAAALPPHPAAAVAADLAQGGEGMTRAVESVLGTSPDNRATALAALESGLAGGADLGTALAHASEAAAAGSRMQAEAAVPLSPDQRSVAALVEGGAGAQAAVAAAALGGGPEMAATFANALAGQLAAGVGGERALEVARSHAEAAAAALRDSAVPLAPAKQAVAALADAAAAQDAVAALTGGLSHEQGAAFNEALAARLAAGASAEDAVAAAQAAASAAGQAVDASTVPLGPAGAVVAGLKEGIPAKDLLAALGINGAPDSPAGQAALQSLSSGLARGLEPAQAVAEAKAAALAAEAQKRQATVPYAEAAASVASDSASAMTALHAQLGAVDASSPEGAAFLDALNRTLAQGTPGTTAFEIARAAALSARSQLAAASQPGAYGSRLIQALATGQDVIQAAEQTVPVLATGLGYTRQLYRALLQPLSQGQPLPIGVGATDTLAQAAEQHYRNAGATTPDAPLSVVFTDRPKVASEPTTPR
ncbi:MAG: filamentous hemagglutinin N-terminal domain-containing protein [Azospirillum sp.]|nr:filamentous hemagglutinin N-terminal domain-containing protein [Azospirillum sp.]